MHEVQDIQPCPLNHVCCRGVAARVGSVHLTMTGSYSYRPEERGPDTPKTMQCCSSRTPILNENLTDHQKPTGSPQTLPLSQHSLHSKTYTMMSVPFNHTGTTHFLGDTTWLHSRVGMGKGYIGLRSMAKVTCGRGMPTPIYAMPMGHAQIVGAWSAHS